ncbi:serine/threonine protein kinase, partial [Bifidobacteriaceae bacterium NR003]
QSPGIHTGYYYVMQDFMVVVPVGAKFDELLNSGYFAGKVENKPDLTRPFILRRNPKLYKQTRVDLPKHTYPEWSPFIPTIKGRAVPFAPAPDDSNAYYLVEEPFDWSSIPGESL